MIKELFGNKYVISILDWILEDVEDYDTLSYYGIHKSTLIHSTNIELNDDEDVITNEELKLFGEAVQLLLKYGIFGEKSKDEYYLSSKWFYILLEVYYEMQINLPENEREIKCVTRFI